MAKKSGNGNKASGNGGGNGKTVVNETPEEASPRGHVVLPPPPPKFDGVIGTTYKDSTMGTFPVAKAPDGAPNVLLVVIDDCGFGQWGTFGGQIPTPNLDRLAKTGLRYTRYHTTALCSPTRAALLTGRNHHSCGTGVITELGDSFPGYTGQIPKSCAMGAEMLRQNGYSTAFFGKDHTGFEQPYHLSVNAQNQAILFITTPASGQVVLGGPTTFPQQTSVHLAGTYDGSQARLYVDAVEVNRMPTTGAVAAETNPVILSGNANGSDHAISELVPGRLSNVMLYRRALSADEIARIRNGAL